MFSVSLALALTPRAPESARRPSRPYGPDPSTLHSPLSLPTPSASPPSLAPGPCPQCPPTPARSPSPSILSRPLAPGPPTLPTPSPHSGPGPRPPEGEEGGPLPLPKAAGAPQRRPQCQSQGGRDCSLLSARAAAAAAAAAKDAQQTMRGPGRLRQPPQPPP